MYTGSKMRRSVCGKGVVLGSRSGKTISLPGSKSITRKGKGCCGQALLGHNTAVASCSLGMSSLMIGADKGVTNRYLFKTNRLLIDFPAT